MLEDAPKSFIVPPGKILLRLMRHTRRTEKVIAICATGMEPPIDEAGLIRFYTDICNRLPRVSEQIKSFRGKRAILDITPFGKKDEMFVQYALPFFVTDDMIPALYAAGYDFISFYYNIRKRDIL